MRLIICSISLTTISIIGNLCFTPLCAAEPKTSSKSAVNTSKAAFQGEWSTASKSGENCRLQVLQTGDKLKGQYINSPYEDDRRIQDGDFTGTIKGNVAHITFTSSFADDKAKGKAELRLAGGKLKWISQDTPSHVEDYSPNDVTLKRIKMITKLAW